MLKYFKKIELTAFVALLGILALSPKEVKASHIPGANLTWTCNPDNPLTYTFTFTEFVSCPQTLTATATGFTITNSCGYTNPIAPTFNQIGLPVDVSQTCSSVLSECEGGTTPGVLMYTYQGTITFPADCDSWIIDYNLCCRDSSFNTTGGVNNDMHIQSVLNTLTAPCNNGPSVSSQPIPYMCANQNNTYCISVSDPDADSTYFRMTEPLGIGGAIIPNSAPYTYITPMDGFSLDPFTGCMTFNQMTTGNYVVTVLVESYDVSGNLISSMIHDFQFEIIACSNFAPSPPSAGIVNTSGSANVVDSANINMCFGDDICFDVVFQDVDSNDTLVISTNAETSFPGSTFTQTGTNPVTGTFCWTASSGVVGDVINFVVEDNSCPIVGTSSFSVSINIADAVYAGPDLTICGPQSAIINSTGGSFFNWSVLSGDPIIVGSNFSCDTCSSVVATPSVTTVYEVSSDIIGCDNKDTIIVTVAPDFTYTMLMSDTQICNSDTVFIDLTSAPIGTIMYIDSIQGYSSMIDSSFYFHNQTFIGDLITSVEIESPSGCVHTDSIEVFISGIPNSVGTIVPNDTLICEFEELVLSAGLGYSEYCDYIDTSLVQLIDDVQVGVNDVVTNTYPTPFGGFFMDSRMQVLYTASDLQAAGTPAAIKQLGFFVVSKLSTIPYENINIKIGCTSADSVSGEFVSGLQQVYNSSSYNSTNGWNIFELDTAFLWDGTSNIFVEFCFDNNAWTQNDYVWRQSLTYPASQQKIADNNVGCSLTLPTKYSTRPVVRFLGAGVELNDYNYTWTPSSEFSISDSNFANTYPSASQMYYLQVTDTLGLCSAQDSVYITLSPGGDAYFSYADLSPCFYSGNLVTDSISTPSGVFTILPNIGINSATGEIDTSNVLVNQAYEVIHTTTGIGRCADADTVLVNFVDLDDASFIFSDYCENSPSFPTGIISSGGTFNFNPPPGDGATLNTSTGLISNGIGGNSYTIEYSTIPGPCSNSSVETVNVLMMDDATFSYSASDFCSADSIANVVSVATIGGQFSSGFGMAINSSTGAINLLNSTPGTYSVQYTTAGICPENTVINVTVNQSPSISFNGINPTCIDSCNGEINCSVTGSGASFDYQWLDSTGTSIGGNDSTINALCEGNYTVTVVSNGLGPVECMSSASYAIVNDGLIDDAGFSFSDFCSGNNNGPDITGLDGGTFSFTIFPSDGADIDPNTGQILNASPGATYVVQYQTNGACPTTSIDTVQTNSEGLSCELIFYSGFTPNNDLVNDVWLIDGIGSFENVNVAIYNRWGDVVWESDNYDNYNDVWDGTNMNNEQMPTGVYYYIVSIEGTNYNGFIELTR